MKICEYIPSGSFFVGGGEIYALMQALILAKRGHDVEVVVLKSEKKSDYFKDYIRDNHLKNLKIVYLNSPIQKEENFDQNVFNHEAGHKLYYSLVRPFTRLCLENKYNFVINHYGSAAIGTPDFIKQILILHGTPHEPQEVNYVAIRIADYVVGDSKSIADGWQRVFNFQGKITVIGNGVDSQKYYPISINEDIDVLYLGRLLEIKGVQDLIGAIALVNKFGLKNLKICIAGMGPFDGKLRELVKDLNLETEIKFLGYVSEKDKNALYNRAKVLVFPSFAKEGVLTTLLEAASSQRAVVTADCCGMVDFIKDNVNGLLFEPRNIHNLARQVQDLLSNGKKRNLLGKNARKDIIKNWTWNMNAEKIEKLINKI